MVPRSPGSGASVAPPPDGASAGRVGAAGCGGTETEGAREGDAGLVGVAGAVVAGGTPEAAGVGRSAGEAGAGATGAGTAGAGTGATGAVVGAGAGLAVAVGLGLDGAVGWQGPRGNTITGAQVSAFAGAAEMVRARTAAARVAATAPGEERRAQR